jgi:CheY-like chemotaxis protein
VQLIRRNGDRLMQIIKELLETSSVEMGHSEIEAGGGGSRFEEREGEAGPFSIATDRGPAGAAPSGPAAPKGHAPESSTAPPAPDKPPTAASAPASKPTLKLSGRVLVAEDCPDNARIVAAMLERAGLSVQTATNGQIACNLALKHHREGRPFDLLLMDLNMPVLDGCDATRLLRAEGYQGPIVALTASTDNCDRGRCVRAGCNAFAGKPIERDALLRTIAAFIPQGAAVTAPS